MGLLTQQQLDRIKKGQQTPTAPKVVVEDITDKAKQEAFASAVGQKQETFKTPMGVVGSYLANKTRGLIERNLTRDAIKTEAIEFLKNPLSYKPAPVRALEEKGANVAIDVFKKGVVQPAARTLQRASIRRAEFFSGEKIGKDEVPSGFIPSDTEDEALLEIKNTVFGEEPLHLTGEKATRQAVRDVIDVGFTFGGGTVAKYGAKTLLLPTAKTITSGLRKVPLLKNTSAEVVQRALGRGITGTGLAASWQLGDEDKPLEDIGKTSFYVGLGSALAPPLTGMTMKYIGKELNSFNKWVSPKYENMIKSLEETAFAQRDTVFSGTLGDYERSFNRSKAFKQQLAQSALKTLQFTESIPTRFSSRLAFTNALSRQLKMNNLSVDDARELEKRMTLALPAASAKAGIITKELDDIAEIAVKNGHSDQLYVYMKALDDLDDVRRGVSIGTVDSLTGKMKSVADIERDISTMTREWGPDTMKALNSYKESYQAISYATLAELKLAGVIDAKQFKNIVNAHPNYIPHKVMVNVIEDGAKRLGVMDSLNLSSTSIFSRKGSERMIEHPILALKERLPLIYATVERNYAMKTLKNVATKHADLPVFKGTQVIKDAQKSILRKEYLAGLAKTKEELANVRKMYNVANKADRKILQKITEYENKISKLSDDAIEAFTKGGESADDLNRVTEQAKKLASQMNKKEASEAYLDIAIRNIKKLEAKSKELYASVKANNAINISDNKLKEMGLAKVSYFVDGEKEVLLVPSRIATAVKNLEYEQLNKTMRFLVKASLSPTMRKYATSRNPSFFLPNIGRDVQSAYINAEYGISAQAFIEAIFDTNPALMKKAGSHGAFMGAGINQGDDIAELVAKDMYKKNWHKITSMNPMKQLDEISRRTEDAVRAGVFSAAMKNGATPSEAAFAARNASVDFGRIGSQMAIINKFIPFLNARLQGTLQFAKSFRKNPELVMDKLFWSSALPETMLYQYNRQFESYSSVSDFFKSKYHVIMITEQEGVDDQGNLVKIPIFVTLPKAEPQVIVGSIIRQFLEKSDGVNKNETSQVLANAISALSPVDLGALGKDRPLESFVGSLGPIPRMVTGALTGRDPFTGYNIIPPSREGTEDVSLQRKVSTTKTATAIGNAIGVSPAKVEFYAQSAVPALRDVFRGLDLAASGFTGEGIESRTDTELGKASRIPIVGTFVREQVPRETLEAVKLKSIIDKYAPKAQNIKARKSLEIDTIVKTLGKERPENRGALWNALVAEGVITNDNAKDIKDRISNKVTYTDAELRKLGVETWGISMALHEYFMSLSPEKRQSEWNRLSENGIISKTVSAQLHYLAESR